MHRLRAARSLAQAVLAWFALTVCAATWAPLVHHLQRAAAVEVQALAAHHHDQHNDPHAAHHAQVASQHAAADPDRSVPQSSGGPAHPTARHGMECALCLLAAPTTHILLGDLTSAAPAQRVVPLVMGTHPRQLAAAPFPARGPPPLA